MPPSRTRGTVVCSGEKIEATLMAFCRAMGVHVTSAPLRHYDCRSHIGRGEPDTDA
jgi:hypothetical protein